MAVLFWLRYRVPDPVAYEIPTPDLPAGDDATATVSRRRGRQPLPPLLWQYVGAVGVLSCGLASFPLLAFHAQAQGLLTEAQIPVLFAVAMLVDGASGLVTGRIYDRRGPRVLLLVRSPPPAPPSPSP
jgi:hypothetical protein